jgi:AraC-like DNA-binding protein
VTGPAAPSPAAEEPLRLLLDRVTCRVVLAGRQTMPPAWSLPPRTLLHHDIIFVEAGSGVVECGGRRRAVSAPAWVILPEGVRHALKGRGLRFSVVHLQTRLGAQLDALKVFCPDPAISPDLPGEAREFFQRAIDSWLEQGAIGRVSANRWMELWFARAFGHQAKVRSMDPRLLNTLAAFHAQVGRPFAMRDAAREAGVSPAHLRSLFHRYLGASPKRILQEIRLDRARQLLEASEAGVAEAAYQVGWEDVSGFSKSFRRRYGISPGAFRRLGAGSRYGL